ncbi:MAG: ATP-dependent helicase, partial [Candidatus Egerieousia sp.]
NIPYRIYQGHSFYERAEVKDMLAYLRLIVNPQDDEAFYRIVNFPARGIGDTTLQRVRAWSAAKEKAAVELINEPGYEEFGLKDSVIVKLRDFVSGIMELREQLSSLDAFRMAVAADMKFGIRNSMKSDKSLEEQAKLENVEELFNSIEEFVEEGEEQLQGEAMEEGLEPMEEQLPQLLTLDLYLQKVALISDSDTKEAGDDNNKVSLMTVHTSKGLEFPYVIVAGMEEGMIPAVSSLSPESELEEERRVFYVAMTRAGRVLKLSYAASRMKFGSRVSNPPSRFIKEIGERYLLNPIEREYGSGALQGVPLRGGAPFRQGGSFSQNSSFRQGGSFSQSASFRQGGSFSQSSSLRQSGSLRPGASIRQSGGLQQQAAAPKANFIADSPLLFKEGMRIEHERFGEGRILSMEGSGVEKRAIVLFDSCGEKKLLLKYARIRIVKEQ